MELTTDGKSMTIAPVDATTRQVRVRDARKKINAQHKAAFKKLAE